jgi:hypothetical protein
MTSQRESRSIGPFQIPSFSRDTPKFEGIERFRLRAILGGRQAQQTQVFAPLVLNGLHCAARQYTHAAI